MGHFQTKKPRDKARREFRHWRMSPAGHWGALPYEAGFGKIKTRIGESLSMEKNAVYARFWEFSSWTSVLDSTNICSGKSHLAPILLKSRQNSPEGLVYGNSNATTALANSRLVVPALRILAAKLTHWTLLTIFASSAITENCEQGFD